MKRGMTLREAAKRSGLSHSYISSLEQGKHPRTKAPISPSPESLKGLSAAYNYPYEELMIIAGHIPGKQKESADTLPEGKLYEAVKRVEEKLKIKIEDDPDIMEGLENYLLTLGKMKNKLK